MTIGSEETTVCKQPGHHQRRADEENRATTEAVHPNQGGNSHDDVDDVLDGGRYEECISSEASHGEDISLSKYWL